MDRCAYGEHFSDVHKAKPSGFIFKTLEKQKVIDPTVWMPSKSEWAAMDLCAFYVVNAGRVLNPYSQGLFWTQPP